MTSLSLRRFNDNGIDALKRVLAGMREAKIGSTAEIAVLTTDRGLTEVVDGVKVDRSRTFADRFDCAAYVYGVISASGGTLTHGRGIDDDRGLWTWLATLWAAQLTVPDTYTKFPTGEDVRWILSTSEWNRFYRHLIAGPYWVYRAHVSNPQRVKPLLSAKMNAPGEMYQQVASRQTIVRNGRIMDFINRLYVDRSTQKIRRGALSKGPGSIRRLAQVLHQFDLTFDVYDMEQAQLESLLPAEFGRWLS
jgi:hypothetical protein